MPASLPRSAHWARLVLVAYVASLAFAACSVRAPQVAPSPETGRLHALLINGGGRPNINYQSHLLHVRQLLALLEQAGVARDAITIFSSDGADPGADLATRVDAADDLWRLNGTNLPQLLRPVQYTDTVVDGYPLRPATEADLAAWFAEEAQQLRTGDTLLLYVTDHGEKNQDDPSDNTITLWGNDQKLSVSELRRLLTQVPAGVRVVALMSQCFSGSFSGIIDARQTHHGFPDGSTCGFFASTRDRPAYGCYPENRGKENVGHSFRFFHGLTASGSFAAAHVDTLVSDATPDVPLRTSDTYLRDLLRNAAAARGQKIADFADEMLREALQDRARWEPDLRLLDRIGAAFGFFSPRSLREVEEQRRRLPKLALHMRNVSNAWRATLGDSNRALLQRLLGDDPAWTERLQPAKVRALDDAGLAGLTEDLLAAVEAAALRHPETEARLLDLHRRGIDAAATSYRMEVRFAAVLRMRMLLLNIAGRHYLAAHGSEGERQAYAGLVACEDLRLPGALHMPALDRAEPFPPFDDDVARATAALPAWMGIRFRPVTDEVRQQYDLAAGAARVLTVYPDSPAAKAGMQVGDIVIGPPQQPFDEVGRVRSWTMLSPIGAERRLEALRDGTPLALTLVPEPYPLEFPRLPGPPAAGDAAPPLALQSYRGDPATVARGEHLLFFWATWCGPCKAAVPQVLDIERTRGIPVLAITDEEAAQLDRFFAQTAEFPAVVAIDEFRQTFQAYGVSGTPTFVHVGADGKVRKVTTGYKVDEPLLADDFEAP